MLKTLGIFRAMLKDADWSTANDIKKTFGTADIVPCEAKGKYNRVVFNIGGNKYRLICSYFFGKKNVTLYVRFVGTHEEYNVVDHS